MESFLEIQVKYNYILEINFNIVLFRLYDPTGENIRV